MLTPSTRRSGGKFIFPKNLVDMNVNPAAINFQYYRNDFGALRPESNITLMMPDEISQPNTVSWDNEKFGLAGEMVRQGMRKFAGSDTSNAQTVSSMIDAVNARVTNSAVFNTASVGVNQFGSEASAAGLMGAVKGVIANPYVTAIFRGVDFRSFEFVFRFTPLSESDCGDIDNIISEMRRLSLPDYRDGGSYLSYPYECTINYLWKGQRNKWLNRFKRCACTKIDINYTGAGAFTAMRNGFPSQIVLSTSWTELDLVVREDINRGY